MKQWGETKLDYGISAEVVYFENDKEENIVVHRVQFYWHRCNMLFFKNA